MSVNTMRILQDLRIAQGHQGDILDGPREKAHEMLIVIASGSWTPLASEVWRIGMGLVWNNTVEDTEQVVRRAIADLAMDSISDGTVRHRARMRRDIEEIQGRF